MENTREILVTNDDGYSALGIRVLAEMLRDYGNVTVVAPREPQSGKSVSLTLDKPLMIELLGEHAAEGGKGSLRAYSLTGTPADCAKLGINMYIHEGRLPDLLVSGINHGSNASAASIYSGTLGAAEEGTLYGVPSVGLSVNTHDPNADFDGSLFYGRKVVERVLAEGLRPGIYLNVNVPAIPRDDIRGIRFGRQGLGRWIKEFDHRITLRGKHYFWMVGEFEDLDDPGAPDADHHIVDGGYVSIVPHRVDTTDYGEMERLGAEWTFD
ncbi:MAG: 5'/3'-nucleotidase SurE [Bacteroidales bacterium]|nr:5'/3'-nucleotidase SurE [Bacteroidales bacterium]MBR0499726.1 5'/3'-nucleotidase SurE [Bacteroidales bacterium]